MQFHHFRHATSIVTYQGKRILVDPMFSPTGKLPATQNTPNQRPNPLVDLPVQLKELLDVDAIVITHTHRDHLDEEAIHSLPKDLPLLCQPPDFEKLIGLGFTQVTPVEDCVKWLGMNVTRIGGQHGTGEIGEKMGPVSGYIFSALREPTLYIAGDTIWCDEVADALAKHSPDVVVLFAGAAQFLTGDPITMTAEDIQQVALAAPNSKIVVAHMESWNHCLLTREELHRFLNEHNLIERVWVPEDGESMEIAE